MNNILFAIMIWVPLDGAVPGSVTAETITQTFATAEECDQHLDGDTRIYWSNKPGHRLLGMKQCTDGTKPSSVSIGELVVTVDQAPANQ